MRTAILGFQSKSSYIDLNATALNTGWSYDTTISRTGGVSLKCIAQSGSSTVHTLPGIGGGVFHRFYLRVTSRPSTTARIIWGGTGGANLRLNPDGTIAYYTSTTLVGTSATALTDTTKWYRIECRGVPSGAGSVDYLKIDDETLTGTVSVGATTVTNQIGPSDTVADTYTVYYADFAEDELQFPGACIGINLALPISDNARAAKWTGGIGGTTNLYDAVNNTPPTGTATETDTSQIEHSGGGAGNEDYDANLTTYTNLGVGTLISSTQTYQTATDGSSSLDVGNAAGNFYGCLSFTAPATGAVRSIAVRLSKTGGPADNLLVELWSNNSSQPGTKISDLASIGGGLISGATDRYVLWATNSTGLVTNATRYWIVFKRSGSTDAANFYNIKYHLTASAEDVGVGTSAPSWTMTTGGVGQLEVAVGDGDQVLAIQSFFAHGEDINTGTKTLTYGLKSNPAQTFAANFSAGNDGGALGTYPTGWIVARSIVFDAPHGLTVGNSPVLTARRPSTETRVASVCFMGSYVEWATYTTPTPESDDAIPHYLLLMDIPEAVTIFA